MTVEDLKRLYDYNNWANRKLFAVIAELTPEQFTQFVAGSYGSVRNTLVHMMSAEWGWIDRSGGPKRPGQLKADDYPTPASVIDQWAVVEGYACDFLSALTDEDLRRVMPFKFGQGPTLALAIGEMLQHAANHTVHHRGQVALLLRALGYAPGNVDLMFYDLEKRVVNA